MTTPKNGFLRYADFCRRRVDCYLTRYLQSLPCLDKRLIAAMQEGLLLGGKRLRPLLVYLVGKLLAVPLSQLDPLAAAVESIHAYSLLHDDLPALDNSPLRRGKPSGHIKFGEAHAILAGDALQMLAFTLLSQPMDPPLAAYYQLQMVGELARASGVHGMCSGQALDLQAVQQSISLSELQTIHRYKTGSLLRCAIRLGAYAAEEVGQAIFPALDRFADAIGLAFQICDDLLDVVGQIEQTGKIVGTDAAQGKPTYPALLGKEEAQHAAQKFYREALTALAEIPFDTYLLQQFAHFVIARGH